MDISDARILQGTGTSGTRFIHLPNQQEDVDIVSLDIGGSLVKVVYFTRTVVPSETDEKFTGGRLHFERFTTLPINTCLDFVSKLNEEARTQGRTLVYHATGGGAHKYAALFKEQLNVVLQPHDEMRCLVVGLNFLLQEVPFEVFTIPPDITGKEEELEFQPVPPKEALFPYLLVNIGSGVSILKITSETTFERVSGTSLGGGTLWGLLSLLTECKDYDEMLSLSTKGDNRNVDMLVGDIYGMDYSSIGLKSTTIASSFGKCFQRAGNAGSDKTQFRQEDICRSLLYMLSNNIGQIAFLNATIHNVSRIYFGGSFIRGHLDTMKTMAFAINFWSKGTMKAHFLRHDGYIGALGAFLRSEDPTIPPTVLNHRGSFSEVASGIQRISDSDPVKLK